MQTILLLVFNAHQAAAIAQIVHFVLNALTLFTLLIVLMELALLIAMLVTV
jgi:hypothetical protein